MTSGTETTATGRGLSDRGWYGALAIAGLGWYLAYGQLSAFAEWATSPLPVDRASHAGEAIAFFAYDVPKVLLLLVLIVFVTGVLRSYFLKQVLIYRLIALFIAVVAAGILATGYLFNAIL